MTGFNELAIAICLVMVLEGLLPFISPNAWRKAMLQALVLSDKQLRLIGLGSMLSGCLFLQWLQR